MKTLTLTAARNQLLKIAEEIHEYPEQIVEVSKRGKPVLALLSFNLYESLVETLELLSDEAASEKLRRALRELEKGKTIPWNAAKVKLGVKN